MQKALYGLKQSVRAWHEMLQSCLIQIGFVKSVEDQSLYVCIKDGVDLYLFVYVDDVLLFGSSFENVQGILDKITALF